MRNGPVQMQLYSYL